MVTIAAIMLIKFQKSMLGYYGNDHRESYRDENDCFFIAGCHFETQGNSRLSSGCSPVLLFLNLR